MIGNRQLQQPQASEKTPLLSPGGAGSFWEQCRIICMTSLGLGSNGYCMNSIGTVILLLGDSLSPAQQGATASAYVLGALAGQMLFGVATDLLGPRLAGLMSTACVMFGACVAASAGLLGPMSMQLVFGRFILGIGAGAEYAIPASLAASLKSEAVEQRTVLLAATFFAVLLAGMQFLIALPMLSLQISEEVIWRCLLAAGALPALIVFIFRLGLDQSELKVRPCAPQSYGHELSESLKGKRVQFYGVCLSWSLFSFPTSSILAFGPVITQQVLGASLAVEETADIRETISLTLMNWVTSFALVICLKPIVKLMALKGATVASLQILTLLLILCVFLLQHNQTSVFLFSYGLVASGQMIPLATLFAITGEMFSASTVGFYAGIAVATQKASACLATFLCPILLDSLGTSPTLLIWATSMFFSFVVAALCLPGAWCGGTGWAGGGSDSSQTEKGGSPQPPPWETCKGSSTELRP